MKQKDEHKLPDISVKADILAAILGISERRVIQLAEVKVIPREAPGKYYLFRSIQGYIRYLRRLSRWYKGNLQVMFKKLNVKTHYETMDSYEDIMAEGQEQPFSREELKALFPGNVKQ